MIMRLRGGVGMDNASDIDPFDSLDSLDDEPGSSVPEVSRRKNRLHIV
jgi:hypothetical protein